MQRERESKNAVANGTGKVTLAEYSDQWNNVCIVGKICRRKGQKKKKREQQQIGVRHTTDGSISYDQQGYNPVNYSTG